MATKKTTTAKAPAEKQAEEQKNTTPDISVRIDKLVDIEGSRVKAFASANIGGAFAIHGIRVIDSPNGKYVAMPSRAYQKDGKTEYADVFHPITTEARNALNDAVMKAYEQRQHEELAESETMDEVEQAPIEQKM